jgi:hypothetical protein
MQNSFDMTTIVFALLAAFVVWKLRSVLGTRNGAEKPRANPFASGERWRYLRGRRGDEGSGDSEKRVIPLPGAAEPPAAAAPDKGDRWKPYAEPGSSTWAGLDSIAAADPLSAQNPGAVSSHERNVSACATAARDKAARSAAPGSSGRVSGSRTRSRSMIASDKKPPETDL